MIILGIDPGTAVTGIGLIRFRGEAISVVDYRAVETSPQKKLPERLKEIYDAVSEVIREFSPQYCIVEQVFGGKNLRSTLLIGQARGAAIMAAVNAGIAVAEYSPREIKMSVVGNGNASKPQVQFMVRNILGLRENPEPPDCADALAAAICHANRIKLEGRLR